jgi:recombination protein RecT
MSVGTEIMATKANAYALLEKWKVEFANALPRHIKIDQFLRVALTTITKNRDLLQCTQASVLGCLIQSAQLGLQVDGLLGEAYLIPFNNKQWDGSKHKECQLIIGYRGFMKLGRNSGEVSTFKACTVYHGDKFVITDGLEPRLEHEKSETPPDFSKGFENAVRGAYAIARMKDGSVSFVFLWKWEIDRARNASKAKDSKTSPWTTHYPEMCEKTAIRRLAKYMPQSPDLQRAAILDELADAGLSQGLVDDAIDTDASTVMDDADQKALPAAGGSKLDAIVNAREEQKKAASQPARTPDGDPTVDQGQPKADGRAKRKPEGAAGHQKASQEQQPPQQQADGNPNYADNEPDPFSTGELFGQDHSPNP